MLHAIASAFAGIALFISSLFGIVPAQNVSVGPAQTLGAALPSGTAVFETSLQSRISSTDTSMTLVANSVRGGTALTGFQCFTVDEGRTDAEYICGTISGTSVTGLTRGIDPQTGTTSNSTLKFAHRVGANVKITDFPVLQILRNQANGADTYPNTLRYAAGVVPSTIDDLTDKAYVDNLAFSGAGVIDASSIAKGVVELATGCEAASSTASGSSGTLAIPASLASSTRTSAALSACKVVVANNSGLIDDNYISTSTLNATSSIAQGPIGYVGKNVQVFSSTGTTTFSVPTGVVKVTAETEGAGGGGGSCSNAVGGAGGGGAGGYAIENVNVSGTSTIQVFVGTGGASASAGTWSTFGTNGFYLSASGGLAGNNGTASNAVQGGTPGVGSGGDINTSGQAGGNSSTDTAVVANTSGGLGGTSHFGGGAMGAVSTGGGTASGNYGGGGGGASCGTNGAQTGGAGGQGIVIVRW